MLIALDADGVALDLHTPWADEFYQRTGVQVTPAEMNDWRWDKRLSPALRKEWWKARSPELYKKVEPIPGAVEGYRKLLGLGHRIVFVTADTPEFVAEKNACLARHFLARSNIVYATNKRAAVKADLFIDDALHNEPDILFDQPWNQEPAPYAERVRGWDELVEAVGRAYRARYYYPAA